MELAHRGVIEAPASWVSIRRSDQLSYRCNEPSERVVPLHEIVSLADYLAAIVPAGDKLVRSADDLPKIVR